MSFKWIDSKSTGFTLAELLIALGILAIIATFTIPKVLQNQQQNKYKAIAKEAASSISDAFQSYKLQSTVSASTSAADFLPSRLNYIRIDTVNSYDGVPSPGAVCPASWDCSNPAYSCYVLANGAALGISPIENFGGTGINNAVQIGIDPDGKLTGKRDSLGFWLYLNGRITTMGALTQTVISNAATVNPGDCQDPSWFGW